MIYDLHFLSISITHHLIVSKRTAARIGRRVDIDDRSDVDRELFEKPRGSLKVVWQTIPDLAILAICQRIHGEASAFLAPKLA